MRYLELLEDDNKKGTFVGIRFDAKTVKNILQWVEQNNISSPTAADTLHCTLLSDKENKFEWETKNYNGLRIDPSTYKLEKFGEANEVLVLSFKSQELSKRHQAGKEKHNITWDFSEYIPHVTLSYEATDVDLDKLSIPKFSLGLANEYIEAYDKENINEGKEITWRKKAKIKNKSIMFLEQIKRVSLSQLYETSSVSILDFVDNDYVREYAEIVQEKFKDDELQNWIEYHAEVYNALDNIEDDGIYYEVALFINAKGIINIKTDLVNIKAGLEIITFHPTHNMVPNVGTLLFNTQEDAEAFNSHLKLTFDDVEILKESVGIIVKGVNTTADVDEGETERQAKKFGNTIGKDGHPPSYWESAKLAAKEIK